MRRILVSYCLAFRIKTPRLASSEALQSRLTFPSLFLCACALARPSDDKPSPLCCRSSSGFASLCFTRHSRSLYSTTLLRQPRPPCLATDFTSHPPTSTPTHRRLRFFRSTSSSHALAPSRSRPPVILKNYLRTRLLPANIQSCMIN